MAISTYDEQFLTDEQKRQIQEFTAAWERANAAGNRAGMDAAHAAAERVRAQANYSGGSDGSSFTDLGARQAEQRTYTPAPTPQTYTPAQLPSYEPQTDAVNKLYDAQRDAALAALKSAYEANSGTLEAQREEIPRTFQTQRNATAAQSEMEARRFNEYAAAAGLNSGAGGQARLAMSNQLQGDLSALGQQEAAEQRSLESQIAQLKIKYQNDIASAIAQGEYERAAALLAEYQRAAESAVTTAQAQADENYRGYQSGLAGAQFAADENYRAFQSGVASRESDAENEFSNWQRQLQMAELQAQYGDLSGLRALGVDTSRYEAQLAAANTPRTVYSSSGGGSSSTSGASNASGGTSGSNSASAGGRSQDYDGLYAAARESGNAKSFISNNYKNYGFTSSTGLYDDYTAWADRAAEAEKAEANRITDMSKLGAEAMRILNGLARGYGSVSGNRNIIMDAYGRGEISEAEADYLLSLLGY